MIVFQIAEYQVIHRLGGGACNLYLNDGAGQTATVQLDNVPVAERAYIIDLLRNEKPVYYVHDETKGVTDITVGWEPTGEGEG